MLESVLFAVKVKSEKMSIYLYAKLHTKLFFFYLIYLCCKLHPVNCFEGRGFNAKTAATFSFPEYAYKETSKNEITYHEFEVACEQHSVCEQLEGVQKKACVRRCISYSCYQDIYAFDELEEGEIDVRLNSFKGCVIQRTGNTNRM